MLAKILWLGLAYLAGSFPFGLFIAQAARGIDPRTAGSGNIGATNVARLCGTKLGVLTLACDALKGFVPVAVAWKLGGGWYASLTALACVGGHMFPVFLHYKGGKGVATAIGAVLALCPWAAVVSGLSCAALIAASGFVSVGSLFFAASLPFTAAWFGPWSIVPFTTAIAALIVWKHKDNIRRLLAREEKPWRKKAG
ncbi:putative glycerol-3-phosphate acyltransferase [Fundidesulfovibrio magnetotacticus]|uniref:Glycerol-3-phosphate acyltransferase n=1 Tax=Fundidesulfovibrio magnetotacticus TaxID=2730080 RepID=A0A6V8LYT4_9BACT|nr:glycerol-3-phosphate 1-O-acyltransferase PlsY [Fundidesulfovibrio magnetotacticus]GFK94807.1 putative glycerol-3-phosphate acyltransferase [Fundidesulfovibrio magnetotacticus]